MPLKAIVLGSGTCVVISHVAPRTLVIHWKLTARSAVLFLGAQMLDRDHVFRRALCHMSKVLKTVTHDLQRRSLALFPRKMSFEGPEGLGWFMTSYKFTASLLSVGFLQRSRVYFFHLIDGTRWNGSVWQSLVCPVQNVFRLNFISNLQFDKVQWDSVWMVSLYMSSDEVFSLCRCLNNKNHIGISC